MKRSGGVSKARREGTDDRIFMLIVRIILILLFISFLYPLWFILIASVSDQGAVEAGRVVFWPEGFDLKGYSRVLSNPDFYRAFGNTIFYTVFGTAAQTIATVMCAYALSRRDLKGRSFILTLFIITMYFGGGLIPSYLNVKSMGLTNTRFYIIIAGLVAPTNLIMCRTYFNSSIPWDLHESAFLDGASDFQIFTRIIIPLSKPIIVVMIIFYAVGHWNSYFTPMIYLKDENLFPLQLFLREVLLKSQMGSMVFDAADPDSVMSMMIEANVANQLKYALIVLSTTPILVCYPFLEKYFEKGVMIGSVKG